MGVETNIILFDMEGTIFRKVVKSTYGVAPSAWTVIAKYLGPKAEKEEEITKQKWVNKKYSGYVEWMEDTIRIHKKYGLTKLVFDEIMNSVDYHLGVRETFKELKKRGYITGLVSGGFKAQADRVQRELKINHSFAACEYFWNNKGKLVHWNLLPCDYDGKIGFIDLILKEYGLKPEDCAFVGDGSNDVPIAQHVGVSIAFNGAPELQEACKVSINQKKGKEDFRAILKYFQK